MTVLGGFSWWDASAVLIVLPLVATRSAALLIAVGTAVALDILTPADGTVSLWVWLGVSMLVAAARGYGGCEVLAFPNLLTGRRDEIGCMLFTPIDRAEDRRAACRSQMSAS